MLYPFAAMWVHHKEVLENECSFRDVVEKILKVRRSKPHMLATQHSSKHSRCSVKASIVI